MRYRGSSKIKHEHRMIKGLRSYLESIESWPEIKSIIPGRIKKRDSSGQFAFKFQYPTDTGCKCIAMFENEVQEVFVVLISKKYCEVFKSKVN